MNGRGQVMIITVLTLGGTILGATTIAGLLMLYQIRQATDLASSAKAIFAADAGAEWASYEFFCDPATWLDCNGGFSPTEQKFDQPGESGAKFAVTCYSDKDATPAHKIDPCEDSSTRKKSDQIVSIKSIGASGNTSRAFRLSFQ